MADHNKRKCGIIRRTNMYGVGDSGTAQRVELDGGFQFSSMEMSSMTSNW